MLLLFAFWLLCDFFLLSVWQKTAQPLRSSFPPGGDRQAFLSTTWEMYPLRFQVQISRIQRQNKFSSSRFSDVGDWSKITCKWTNQIFSFFSYFVGTWKQDKRFISSKKFNEITIKVRANIYLLFIYYLFIFIYLFIILFRHGLCFFYNSKLGPHLLPLRVPHRHIRFCLFHESSNMAHEIHFPTEFSSNPNQTHPSMLIKFFRIFKTTGRWARSRLKLKSAAHLPSISIFEEPWFIYLWMKKEGLVDMLFCFFTVEW